MHLDDVQVPAYYILSRSIEESRIPAAVDALSITPPVCAVVTDIVDAQLAHQFSRDILQASSVANAREIALAINADAHRAVLILTDTKVPLTAIYADGPAQEIACS